MARRAYTNTAVPQALTALVDDQPTTTQIPVADTSTYPDPTVAPFTIGIERGTVNEEVCLVTAKTATAFTVTRGYNGTTPKEHGAGQIVEHTVAAIDYDEANLHINDHPPSEVFLTFGKQGTLIVATGVSRLYMPWAGEIAGMRAAVNTAPAGQAIIVRLKKNGVTTVHDFSIPAGQVTDVEADLTADTDADFVEGDWFSIDVVQTGTTTAGSDLTVVLRASQA